MRRSPDGSDIAVAQWQEYKEGRSLDQLCSDLTVGATGDSKPSQAASRIIKLCGWSFYDDAEEENCVAAGESYNVMEGKPTRSEGFTASQLVCPTDPIVIPESYRRCGAQIFGYGGRVEGDCVGRVWLRYDATANGLAHASAEIYGNCSAPDERQWFVVTLESAK